MKGKIQINKISLAKIPGEEKKCSLDLLDNNMGIAVD